MAFEIIGIALQILTSTLFLISLIYYGVFGRVREVPWLKLIAFMLVMTVFAPFIPILLAISFSLSTLAIIRLIHLKPFQRGEDADSRNDGDDTVFVLILKYIFGFILYIGVVFLLLVYAVMLIGRISGMDWYYSISSIVGIAVSVLLIKQHGYNLSTLMKNVSKKNIKAVLLIAAVIFASFSASILISLNSNLPDEVEPSIELKAMSYNILHIGYEGTPKDWDTRKTHLIDHIESQDADIFGVQEALITQLAYLNNSLSNRNYNWYGAGRADGLEGGEHTAIFYDQEKYTILENGSFWLSPTPEVPSNYLTEPILRIISWVFVEDIATGGKFYFYNTHYGFYPEFQIRASILINNHIAHNTGDYPVILTGDFNMPNFFPFYLFLEKWGRKPLSEAYRLTHFLVNPLESTTASGCVADSVGMHIDFVFVSEAIQVTSCEIRRYAYNGVNSPSDHHPIVMECYFGVKG